MHVETFFVGTWEVSSMPGALYRAGSGRRQAIRSVYVDEKSDEVIVLMKRSNKGRQLPAEVGEGRASPKGNS